MKLSVLLFFLIYPICEVENVKLSLPTQQREIFIDYSNNNFSQKLSFHKDMLTAEIKSSNYLDMNLNSRVLPDTKYISALNPKVQEVILDFFDDSESLRNYIASVSSFLKEQIRYSEMNLPQDATAVILNKRARCVGYANAAKVFFDAAGIKCKVVKGFFLKEGKKNTMIPIPHRWVEIRLDNREKFFYDPQYQRFSANYLATKGDVDFRRVKKFKVYIIKKSKKILD
jgi:transglutaminase/protease-like cytokinesis protein 3